MGSFSIGSWTLYRVSEKSLYWVCFWVVIWGALAKEEMAIAKLGLATEQASWPTEQKRFLGMFKERLSHKKWDFGWKSCSVFSRYLWKNYGLFEWPSVYGWKLKINPAQIPNLSLIFKNCSPFCSNTTLQTCFTFICSCWFHLIIAFFWPSKLADFCLGSQTICFRVSECWIRF